MVIPLVDQESAIDPQPDAVVRLCLERMRFREKWLDEAGPPGAKPVRRDAGVRRPVEPGEVDHRVLADEDRAREIGAVEVLAQQAVRDQGRDRPVFERIHPKAGAATTAECTTDRAGLGNRHGGTMSKGVEQRAGPRISARRCLS
jgi:hypothetical protein